MSSDKVASLRVAKDAVDDAQLKAQLDVMLKRETKEARHAQLNSVAKDIAELKWRSTLLAGVVGLVLVFSVCSTQAFQNDARSLRYHIESVPNAMTNVMYAIRSLKEQMGDVAASRSSNVSLSEPFWQRVVIGACYIAIITAVFTSILVFMELVYRHVTGKSFLLDDIKSATSEAKATCADPKTDEADLTDATHPLPTDDKHHTLTANEFLQWTAFLKLKAWMAEGDASSKYNAANIAASVLFDSPLLMSVPVTVDQQRALESVCKAVPEFGGKQEFIRRVAGIVSSLDDYHPHTSSNTVTRFMARFTRGEYVPDD